MKKMDCVRLLAHSDRVLSSQTSKRLNSRYQLTGHIGKPMMLQMLDMQCPISDRN